MSAAEDAKIRRDPQAAPPYGPSGIHSHEGRFSMSAAEDAKIR